MFKKQAIWHSVFVVLGRLAATFRLFKSIRELRSLGMTERDIPPKFSEEFSSFKNNLYFPDAAIGRPTWDRAFKAIFLRKRDLTRRFVNDFFEFESPIT